MSGSGILDPALMSNPAVYAQYQALQRKQALAAALLGAQPSQGAYGGLASAGKNILGAFLAKGGDKDMAAMYADVPANQQQQAPATSPQITNSVAPAVTSQPLPPVPGAPAAPGGYNPQALASALSAPAGAPAPPQGATPPMTPSGGAASPQALGAALGGAPPQQGAMPPPGLGGGPSPQALGAALGGNQPKPADYATLGPIPRALYDGIPHLPGLSAHQTVNSYTNDRQGYLTAAFAAAQQTPDQKNADAAYGAGSPEAQSALQGVVNKAGAIEGRNQSVIITPDGVAHYGPNEENNTYYTTGPNNEPIAHPIIGGAEAAAQTAGAVSAAQNQNKVIEVTLPDGRKVPMRVGDVVSSLQSQITPGQSQPGQMQPGVAQAPPVVPPPPQGAGGTGQGGQFAAPPSLRMQNPAAVLGGLIGVPVQISSADRSPAKNAAVGGVPDSAHLTPGTAFDFVPQGITPREAVTRLAQSGIRFDQLIAEPDHVHVSFAPAGRGQVLARQQPPAAAALPAAAAPVEVGESTAQREVNEARGTAATGNAHAQAVTSSTLKAIDGLIALNDQVPDSTGMSPDWKADINARVPGIFKGDAGALAQWQQLNGIGVLGGLKQLQGLGRLDLPEVNQVVKTNGVPADVPRAQRLQILQNLRTMVANNLAATGNNVANLNQPGIVNSTQTQPMQSYTQRPGAPQQQTQIPTVPTPQAAMALPSGTKFRTPDGRVLVRP